MATRRIPALLVANSSRNAFLTTSRFTPPRVAFLGRQFNTLERGREQYQANVGAKRDPAPKIVRGGSKIYKDADAAVADLKSGSTILSAGFGLCGTAGEILFLG
jgi:3-oxoacid CoA-transferase